MSYSNLPNPYGTPDPIGANQTGALNSTTNANAFTNVSVAGIEEDDSFYTFSISGLPFTNTTNFVNVIGSAMAMDPSQPTTAKLAAANDIILGVLKTLEYRTQDGIVTGAIMTEGGHPMPYDTAAGATPPAVGDSVQGGITPGTVQKLAPAHGRSNVVTSVDTVRHFVTVLFL